MVMIFKKEEIRESRIILAFLPDQMGGELAYQQSSKAGWGAEWGAFQNGPPGRHLHGGVQEVVGCVISHISEQVWVGVIKRRPKRRKCFKMEGVNNSLEFWGNEKHGQRAVSSLETQIVSQSHLQWVVEVEPWLQWTEARRNRGHCGCHLFPDPECLCQCLWIIYVLVFFFLWRVYSNLLPILKSYFSFY